ncbi:MAG TPA: hypothetical protein PL009_11230 [Flavipsychrobacter sp.]|nr:hypothetical protein [Flavipsychrobacter sp.]
MENTGKASIPPDQTEGISKNFEETIEMDTLEEAQDMFVTAKDRLLNVNQWHEVSETIKSQFQIVDHQAHSINRKAHKGDFIKINIPAPGTDTGEGADWVKVDAIEYDDYPDENREVIAMRLRPASNPSNADESVAHFFTDHATSSFVIERHQKKIIARYFGRNEKPNTTTEKLTDTVRNIAVAVGAMLGFSDVQWKGMLKGFLAT